MCGIVMISKLTADNIRMVPFMAYDMERRGYDSFGATNGQEIWKKAVSLSEGWCEFEPTLWSWLGQPLILHTRGASVGKVCDDNAHPFVHKSVVGVHNGHISNHADLNKNHSRNFEVDSQHVIANIAEGLSMSEVRGWGTVVWIDRDPEELRFVTFNGGDWNLYHSQEGPLIGCSEEHVIVRAASMANVQLAELKYKIPTETRFQIPLRDPIKLFKGPSMTFGSRTSYSPSTYEAGAHSSYHHASHSNVGPAYPQNNNTSTDQLDGAVDLAEAFRLAINDAVCVVCYEARMTNNLVNPVCGPCIKAFLDKQLWHVQTVESPAVVEQPTIEVPSQPLNGKTLGPKALYSAAVNAYCGHVGNGGAC